MLGNSSASKHISMATRKYSNDGRDVFYAVHAEI
jgi:hypothetical protein